MVWVHFAKTITFSVIKRIETQTHLAGNGEIGIMYVLRNLTHNSPHVPLRRYPCEYVKLLLSHIRRFVVSDEKVLVVLVEQPWL